MITKKRIFVNFPLLHINHTEKRQVQMTDANEIIHAQRLWFQAGDVFEVHVPDAVSADYRREHIESGYFDYEHISAVPEALKRLFSFRGVYVTS